MEEGNIVDILIYVAYALLGIAAVTVIIMPLINSLSDPKSIIKGLLGVVSILVIYGVAFAISTGEVTSVYMKFGVNTELSKIVGATIISTYILLGISLIGIVFSEIYKLIS